MKYTLFAAALSPLAAAIPAARIFLPRAAPAQFDVEKSPALNRRDDTSLTCGGDDNVRWVLRDTVANVVDQWCNYGGGKMNLEYGSMVFPDVPVVFRVTVTSPVVTMIRATTCKTNYFKLIDSCDLWNGAKHGGTYVDADGTYFSWHAVDGIDGSYGPDDAKYDCQKTDGGMDDGAVEATCDEMAKDENWGKVGQENEITLKAEKNWGNNYWWTHLTLHANKGAKIQVDDCKNELKKMIQECGGTYKAGGTMTKVDHTWTWSFNGDKDF